jgi:long-chain acyl-CoA synthetase
VIAPNFVALEEWARARNIAFNNREELVSRAEVRAVYDQIVAEVNTGLAQFEKLKKVLLIADEFTIANGFLTPTMKLRRRVIEDRYRPQIEQLYTEPAPQEEPAKATS